MSTNLQNNDNDSTVPVRRGKVDSVDLFEVKEHELEILENGGSDTNSSIYLNFSIFLLSISVSSTFSIWATEKFSAPIYQILLLIITVVGFLMGGFLLLLWRNKRKKERSSIKAIVKTIRDRILDCPLPQGTKISIKQQTETDIEIPTTPSEKKEDK